MEDKTKTCAFVDKIEGKYARLLIGKETINWPVKLLPKDAAEGQFVKIEIYIDEEENNKKTKEIQSLIDELKGNN